MARKKMFAQANGLNNIESIQLDESYDSPISTCVVTCESTFNLEVGDAIYINAGTEDNYGMLFAGVIKRIQKVWPASKTIVHIHSVLARANDCWLIPWPTPQVYTNREGGYSAESVVSETLDDALLMEPYTTYSYDATNFYFAQRVISGGAVDPTKSIGLELKLKSRLQACQEIAEMLNWKLWADYAGRIYFKRRYPFVMGGAEPANPPDPTHPSALQSFLQFSKANRNILSVEYDRNTDNTRNEVFVEGYGHVVYEETTNPPLSPASGRYPLPVVGQSTTLFGSSWGSASTYNLNYKQGAAIISSWIVSSETQSQLNGQNYNNHNLNNPIVKAVNSNLVKANRVSEHCAVQVPGDYRIHAITSNQGGGANAPGTPVISFCSLTDDFSDLYLSRGIREIYDSTNGLWFIRSMSSTWSKSSYTCSLGLSR